MALIPLLNILSGSSLLYFRKHRVGHEFLLQDGNACHLEIIGLAKRVIVSQAARSYSWVGTSSQSDRQQPICHSSLLWNQAQFLCPRNPSCFCMSAYQTKHELGRSRYAKSAADRQAEEFYLLDWSASWKSSLWCNMETDSTYSEDNFHNKDKAN